MSDKEKHYLLKLIDKLYQGLASTEEVEHLANFFTSHQEPDSWPADIPSKNVIKERVFTQIQMEMSKRDASNVKIIPFYKKYLFRYAVAASIILLISLTFIFNSKDNAEIEVPIIVNNTIEIGTDKAILTLEDGLEIALEKGQSYTSHNMESTGDKLIYKADKNPKQQQEIAYNYLTIPRGGQYHITLADGTDVWLNSESKIKYPVSFVEGEARLVELVYGEAYFDVSPSTAHKGSTFKVKSNMQEVEVLGTEFNISAYKDDDATYTTLVEGKVAVSNNETNTVLSPKEQAIVKDKNANFYVSTIDVYAVTSWRKGIFSFDNMSLEKIMNVLARWYDIDVIFANSNLKEVNFTGVLRKNQNIEDILNSIKTVNNIAYEIDDKTVIFR